MLVYELPIDDYASFKEYDYESVKKAFDTISHGYQIEFNFPQGGCQQRSHIISMLLDAVFSIEHYKVWIFAPTALFENDFTSLYVEDKNKMSPEDKVLWSYHTAPVVNVRKDGKLIKLVLDPSLNRLEPMVISDWLSAIGNSTKGKYTFLFKEKYFFNCKYNFEAQLYNLFDGTFYEYVNPSRDNLILEKGLAINDMAMSIFLKYIKPLHHSSLPEEITRMNELNEIFGNATVLDLLFNQNISGNTEATSYRYVIINYGSIMKEAKMLFFERLKYWTEFTNTLIQPQTVNFLN